jgi:general secretion pathway protein A
VYTAYFGLKREPFSIAPDPRFLYMSERHREALAHLLYGLDSGGGFVLLSGEIGAGKTTVCRAFLERMPKRCNVAYIFNPKLTVVELLQSVCSEFRIPLPAAGSNSATATVKEHIDPLNDFLLKTHAVGQNNVLIIDEAQNLSSDVLEQLRLLTNLETNERKLLQIILIGQPELRDMLARPELEQLAQRVTARFHLDALSEAETVQYIRHRLTVAGMRGAVPFDSEARSRIHQLARGVPRRINLLCDRALLGAYSTGQARVNSEVVDRAADEVFGRSESRALAVSPSSRTAWWAFGGLALLVLFGLVTWAAKERMRSQSLNLTPALSAASAPASSSASIAKSAAAVAVAVASSASAALPSSTLTNGADLQSNLSALLSTEDAALRELLLLWKVNLSGAGATNENVGDACAAAQRSQVFCLRSKSNLAVIRQLNRPGIVTLFDSKDQPHFALLTALTSQTATLRAAGVSRTVPLWALAALWRGDFATLWKAPADYRAMLQIGSVGSGVRQLAVQLAALQGQPPPAVPPNGVTVFDAAMKAKVDAFQVSQGLTPDGVVGPTTFMQLNRATGVDEPRLFAEVTAVSASAAPTAAPTAASVPATAAATAASAK